MKAKLELLEKELDGLLDPLDKSNVDITQRLPDPPWPLPRHYQASFGHYQDTLASTKTLPSPLVCHDQAPFGHYQAIAKPSLAITKPPLAITKPLPSTPWPLPSHYQAPFCHY